MNKGGQEIAQKVAKVREVVNGVSTNDIILALHSYDLNVERTIQAFCEGMLILYILNLYSFKMGLLLCSMIGFVLLEVVVKIRKRRMPIPLNNNPTNQ